MKLFTSEQEQAMWSLFGKHFIGVAPSRFQEDLAHKNWVLLIQNEDELVVGISTLLFEVIELDGAPVSLLYSGDTIMDHSAWGSSILSRAWIHSLLHLNETYGEGRLEDGEESQDTAHRFRRSFQVQVA